VDKAADVGGHRGLAGGGRTSVIGMETVPFQEPAQSDIVPTVKIHFNHPIIKKKMKSSI